MTSLVRLLRQLRAKVAQHPPHTGQPNLPAPNLPNRASGLNYQDLFDPQQPITVQVTDYVDSQVGDGLVLYWNDIEISSETFSDEHKLLRVVTFRVLPGLIPLVNGRRSWLDTIATYPLHYHVQRLSGNEALSFNTDVLVKTTVPGGLNPDPATPTVNENLALPQGIPPTIDITGPPQPLLVTIAMWENAYVGDVLTLHWSGQRIVRAPLTAAEAGAASVTISVPWSVIVQQLGDNLIVRYDVRDVVNNWSLFSRDVRVDVEDGSTLLYEPYIYQAPDGLLDLDALNTDDVEVFIPSDRDVLVEGTWVELVWTGTTAEGSTLVHRQQHQVARGEVITGFWLMVPNSVAVPLSGGYVRVVYQTVASPVHRSRAAEAVVVGQPFVLAVPQVEHVSGTTLQLALVGSGPVRVTVPVYDVMDVGDTVHLYWRGTSSSGSAVEYTDTINIDSDHTGQPVVFAVPNQYAVVLAGSNDLQVSYRVVTKDQIPHDSPVLTLSVTELGGNLIAPWLESFRDAIIDPDQVTGATRVLVGNYTGKAVDDKITLNWVGDTTYTAPWLPVTLNNLHQDIAFTIAKDPHIIGNSRVDLSYQVQRASGGSAGSLTLPVTIRAGGVQPLPLPVVVEANPANVLDPANARNGATIRITDPNFLPGDVIAAFWVGNDGLGTPTLEWVPYASGFTVDVPVPASAVAANLGRSVQVLYSRIRGGASPASESLVLQVREFAEGVLPTPTILTVAGSNLNLNTLLGDATVHIAPWPLIAQGQALWLRLHSTDDQNEPWSTELILAGAVTAAEVTAGVSRLVPRAVLLKLQNGAAVNLEFKVGFGGGLSEGAATVFPIGSYVMINVVLDLRAPEVAYHQDGYLDPALVPESGLPVTVAYGGMAQAQVVQVIMAGPNGAEHALTAQTVAPGQTELEFKVPKSLLDAYEEKTLVIYYTVSLVAGGLKQSSRTVVFRYGSTVGESLVEYTQFGPVGYLNGWAPDGSVSIRFDETKMVAEANIQVPSTVLSKRLTLPVGNYVMMIVVWTPRAGVVTVHVDGRRIISSYSGSLEFLNPSGLFVSTGQPLDIEVRYNTSGAMIIEFYSILIARVD